MALDISVQTLDGQDEETEVYSGKESSKVFYFFQADPEQESLNSLPLV